jgi:DNA-binding NarL/FixJ family response regulator
MTVVGEATSGREAIESFRSTRPDITLMDLQMPDMDGIDAILAIRSEFPNARIIVLTTYEGDALAYRAHKHIQSEVAVGLADHAADDPLTEREIEVLTMIGDGNSNKIIADKLSITEHTVKGHVKSILSKLGASDRTHAVKLGLKRGITRL